MKCLTHIQLLSLYLSISMQLIYDYVWMSKRRYVDMASSVQCVVVVTILEDASGDVHLRHLVP